MSLLDCLDLSSSSASRLLSVSSRMGVRIWKQILVEERRNIVTGIFAMISLTWWLLAWISGCIGSVPELLKLFFLLLHLRWLCLAEKSEASSSSKSLSPVSNLIRCWRKLIKRCVKSPSISFTHWLYCYCVFLDAAAANAPWPCWGSHDQPMDPTLGSGRLNNDEELFLCL